mmetsp:Transcript_27803/g.80624  ORF Transcript_27803/g.80624 Transcript_27803/m.80624 type:complete len:320 (-) Transcript_27803:191-1150(-)
MISKSRVPRPAGWLRARALMAAVQLSSRAAFSTTAVLNAALGNRRTSASRVLRACKRKASRMEGCNIPGASSAGEASSPGAKRSCGTLQPSGPYKNKRLSPASDTHATSSPSSPVGSSFSCISTSSSLSSLLPESPPHDCRTLDRPRNPPKATSASLGSRPRFWWRNSAWASDHTRFSEEAPLLGRRRSVCPLRNRSAHKCPIAAIRAVGAMLSSALAKEGRRWRIPNIRRCSSGLLACGPNKGLLANARNSRVSLNGNLAVATKSSVAWSGSHASSSELLSSTAKRNFSLNAKVNRCRSSRIFRHCPPHFLRAARCII